MKHRHSRFRRRAAAMAAGVALLVPLLGASAAFGDDPDPLAFDTIPGADPHLDATARTQRLWGADRENTALAAAYYNSQDQIGGVANDDGLFPNADRTGNFFGPFSVGTDAIIVTARDKFPDALAGAPLVDGNNTFTDPTMVPVGQTTPVAVDTDGASIVLTASGREGATSLSVPAIRAAKRYKGAGADQAIILGGTQAVPSAVEGQLAALGYQVFRIAGSDRFDTAAQIALKVGTGSGGQTACDDSPQAGVLELWSGDDMSTECTPLNKTVILADGRTGADALAISPIAAWNHVPILLTDGATLPPATQNALNLLSVQNIVVIGGTDRIPAATANQAAAIAGVPSSAVTRIAGANRYATSVEIAKQLAGYQVDASVTDPASTYEAAGFCLARSEGEGDNAAGWPDALAAGPTCMYESGGYGDNHPQIEAAPIEGAEHNSGSSQILGHPAREQMPLLLTPKASLASEVAGFVAGLFPTSATYCTGDASPTGCSEGGWGLLFGGTGAIASDTELAFAQALSGGTYTAAKRSDLSPTLDAAKAFYTRLSFDGGLFEPIGSSDADKLCTLRGALSGVEYLGVYDDAALTDFDQLGDLLGATSGGYANLPSSSSPASSIPTCTAFQVQSSGTDPGVSGGDATLIGTSLSDHFTAGVTFNFSPAKRLATSGIGNGSVTSATAGPPFSDDPNQVGAPTATLSNQATFSIGAGGTVTVGTTAHAVTGVSVTITLDRPDGCTDSTAIDTVPCTFTGTFVITTAGGTITGNIVGEALQSGSLDPVGSWTLNGMYTITGGTLSGVANTGKGGFTATWETNTANNNTDDQLTGAAWDGLNS